MVLVKGKIRQMGSEEWESFEESVEPRIDTKPENMRRQMKMHFHFSFGRWRGDRNRIDHISCCYCVQ